MSIALPTTATIAPGGLPPVNEAREPASVREGSPAAKRAYATALGFEAMLVQELSQSLLQGSGLTGADETMGAGSGEAGASTQPGGSSVLSSLLPQTFAEGVMRQGGLGLAAQLMGALDPAGASHPAAVSDPGVASVLTAASDRAGATGGTSA